VQPPRKYLWNLCQHGLIFASVRLCVGKRAGGLIDKPFRKKNFGYSGVYRLYGVASEDGPGFKKGWPGVINRACGTDMTGTLYIGRARRLSDRLNGLRRALLTGHGSHDVPSMLRYLMRLHQAYPSNTLKVALLPFANYKRVESDLIDAYVNSFGELPPLWRAVDTLSPAGYATLIWLNTGAADARVRPVGGRTPACA
jgi:hypothetical protein